MKKDFVKSISVIIASEDNIESIFSFQKSIIDNMTNREWFTPLTYEEFLTPIKGKDNAYLHMYNNEIIG